MNVEEADRLDYDEAMLPEDSWERTLDEDEFEVETIMDVRSGKKACLGIIYRQYFVRWKGSGDPTRTQGRLELSSLAESVRSRSGQKESLRDDAITRNSGG